MICMAMLYSFIYHRLNYHMLKPFTSCEYNSPPFLKKSQPKTQGLGNGLACIILHGGMKIEFTQFY